MGYEIKPLEFEAKLFHAKTPKGIVTIECSSKGGVWRVLLPLRLTELGEFANLESAKYAVEDWYRKLMLSALIETND